MKIIKAIVSHVQEYSSKKFEKTIYGKRITALKNSHLGQNCFIIGNGPSLKASDLQKIYEKGIICFGTNRIFNIFDQTDWRPTYYVSEDEIILKDIQKIIPTIPAKKHFIPIRLKWDGKIDVKNADFFYLDYDKTNTELFGLTLDVAHGIPCKGTVTITCIQLAVYMGFQNIYLIGVDHNYSKIIDENGQVVEDKTIKDYFSDKYDTGIKEQLVHNLGAATRAFYDVEQLSKKIGTFNVFNATRGGKLEVFKRVDIDELLNNL